MRFLRCIVIISAAAGCLDLDPQSYIFSRDAGEVRCSPTTYCPTGTTCSARCVCEPLASAQGTCSVAFAGGTASSAGGEASGGAAGGTQSGGNAGGGSAGGIAASGGASGGSSLGGGIAGGTMSGGGVGGGSLGGGTAGGTLSGGGIGLGGGISGGVGGGSAGGSGGGVAGGIVSGGGSAGGAVGGGTAGGAVSGGGSAGGTGGGGANGCTPACTSDEVCQSGTCRWNNPSLSGLAISPGALTFLPSQSMYSVTVPAGTSSVAVTATVPQPARVTLRINQTASASGSPLTVPLSAGSTSVTISVQAESGATKVYTVVVVRSAGQQAYVKASNTGAGDYFGYSVAVSADGSTLAVSATRESSSATRVNGSQADNSASWSGAVYVFRRTGSLWIQEAYLKASNTQAYDSFGSSVAVSADGRTVAVGANLESSRATGVNGDQADNSASWSGAVYVFRRSGSFWIQEAYLKASNTGANDNFGYCVAVSGDGNTLAVGADREDSSATGINGSQADNSASSSGAVYVFRRTGTAWTQETYLKASNTGADDHFGFSVAVSDDGSTLAVGSSWEDSSSTGVNGNQADNSALKSGAVYVFRSVGSAWTQEAYLKASNSGADDSFGFSVAVSADGSTLAVGAQGEDSGSRGANGNQADNSEAQSGAVYVFRRSGGTWAQEAYLKASNPGADDVFGFNVAVSADGNALAVGAPGEDSGAIGANGNEADNSALKSGAVYLFRRTGSTWTQETYLKASNTEAGDDFGRSVAVSAAGTTLSVGASGEDSSATGVNGGQTDNSVAESGAAYVF